MNEKELNILIEKLKINNLTDEERITLCETLPKLRFLYIIECCEMLFDKLVSLLDYDYNFPKDETMPQLFNVTKREFHRKTKGNLKKDFNKVIKNLNIDNFDIGYHKKTRLIMFNCNKNKKLLVIANLTIENYNE